MFYLTMHSTHFIYSYMTSDVWLRTIVIVRTETCCRHIGYSFRLTATVLLYAPSHRQDSTYHSLCYNSRGTLAGTRNCSMGPSWRIDPTTHRTVRSGCLTCTYSSSVWGRKKKGRGGSNGGTREYEQSDRNQ